MKITRILPVLAASCCLLAQVIYGTGCSLRPGGAQAKTTNQVLSSNDAAQLAAKLANDECERLYKRRPFTANLYPAVLQDAEYHWGRLDEGGPGGYSAQVTFAQDGSKPKVEVYFSTDRLDPIRSLPPARTVPKP